MEHISIPPTTDQTEELKLSRLAYGFWRLNNWDTDTEGILDRVYQCLDLGITTMDHADVYGGYSVEQQFGKALRQDSNLRSKIQLVTKCGIVMPSEHRPEFKFHYYDTSRKHIISQVERSLKNFNTDYIDLLLIHRPDPLMNAEEVAAAFEELYEADKVRAFGVSNFTNEQYELLASATDLPLGVNQVECSVLHMDPMHDGTLDRCQRKGIRPMAWSPFGGGELFNGDGEREINLRTTLEQVGDEIGAAGIDQVALAWLLKHPSGIIPVIGTGKMERIKSAAASLKLKMNREQWFKIWTASAGHEVP